jgi:putative membrane protein
MLHTRLRSTIHLLTVGVLAAACAETPKEPETPRQEVPTDPAPQPGDAAMPAPSGEPTDMPPAQPPPQGLNGANGNPLAAPAVGTATPESNLTDGQIAMVADTANTAEVEQGKLAQSKATSPRVKKFADMMVKHHGQAKTEQAKLVKELKLSLAGSAQSSALKGDGDQLMSSLRSATGGDFDKTYINGQVQEHQKVLALLDQQLIPAAQNEKVKAALQKARETVASHLEQANAIQAELAQK